MILDPVWVWWVLPAAFVAGLYGPKAVRYLQRAIHGRDALGKERK